MIPGETFDTASTLALGYLNTDLSQLTRGNMSLRKSVASRIATIEKSGTNGRTYVAEDDDAGREAIVIEDTSNSVKNPVKANDNSAYLQDPANISIWTRLNAIDGVKTDASQNDVESSCGSISEILEALNENVCDPGQWVTATPNFDKLAQNLRTPDGLHAHCKICDDLDFGWMVHCGQSIHTKNEAWFHFDCAGLTLDKFLTLGKWYCPECRLRKKFISVPGKPFCGGKRISSLKTPSKASASESTTQIKKKVASPRLLSQYKPSDSQNTLLQLAVVGPSKPEAFAKTMQESVKIRRWGTAQRTNTDTVTGGHSSASGTTNPNSTSGRDAQSSPNATNITCKRGTGSNHTQTNQPTAPSSQSSSTRGEEKETIKAKWNNAHESQCLANLMRDLLAGDKIEDASVKATDEKWQLLADRLQERHGFERTANSIKNFWQRKGRAQFGIDERVVPKPDRMSTSVEDPAERKRRRQDKKKQRNTVVPIQDASCKNGVSDCQQKKTTKRKRVSDDDKDDNYVSVIHHRRRIAE